VTRALAGAARAAREAVVPSVDPGLRPVLGWAKLADFHVDRRYQRMMGGQNHTLVNRIVREFDWSKLQPLMVAAREAGGWWVIDGQHRLEAGRKHPKVKELPYCAVHAPDVAAQALAFVAINGQRIGVTQAVRFHALLAAGEPKATSLKKACDAAGITIGRAGLPVQPPRTTIAVGTLQRLMDDAGAAGTRRALTILADGQPDAPGACSAAAIAAIGRIVADHRGGLDDAVMTAVLQGLDMDVELAAARAWRGKHGGTIETALRRRLVRAYNRRSGTALPEDPR
jgi:hypothetical protein